MKFMTLRSAILVALLTGVFAITAAAQSEPMAGAYGKISASSKAVGRLAGSIARATKGAAA